MKQKSLKYLLLGLVALVWGLIIYRIVDGLGGNDDTAIAVAPKKKIDYTIPIDSFELLATYPDPFLSPADDTETDSVDLATGRQPASPVSAMPAKPSFDFTTIQYEGMMANPENKKKVALISIAGKEYLLKEKDKIDEVMIRKISKDEIAVSVNGETHLIGKRN